jgi:transcription antitermination protein NusB
MGSRRKSRELALQFLYGRELNEYDLKQMFENFWSLNPGKLESREFAERLIKGTVENLESIDQVISRHSHNWSLDRIALTDRCILRVASYELMYCEDVPSVVSINEAVDIAKKFSTPESGRFVNGILDKVRKIVENNPTDDTSNPPQKDDSTNDTG